MTDDEWRAVVSEMSAAFNAYMDAVMLRTLCLNWPHDYPEIKKRVIEADRQARKLLAVPERTP
jgi:hypothetical protein